MTDSVTLAGEYGKVTREAVEARIEEDRWEQTVASLREEAEALAERARVAYVRLEEAKEARDDAHSFRMVAQARVEEVAEALRVALIRKEGK